MMEIETKGAGPKERQEMRMKQEEKREKRWEEKRRREVQHLHSISFHLYIIRHMYRMTAGKAK